MSPSYQHLLATATTHYHPFSVWAFGWGVAIGALLLILRALRLKGGE